MWCVVGRHSSCKIYVAVIITFVLQNLAEVIETLARQSHCQGRCNKVSQSGLGPKCSRLWECRVIPWQAGSGQVGVPGMKYGMGEMKVVVYR